MQPSNTSNFIFSCNRLDLVQQTLTNVVLPSMSIGTVPLAGREHDIQVPSNKATFEMITLEFLLNEDYSNHKEVADWMNEIRNYTGLDITTMMVDAELTVLNNNNIPVARFAIRDVFPTFLGEIPLNFQVDAEIPIQLTLSISDWTYVPI